MPRRSRQGRLRPKWGFLHYKLRGPVKSFFHLFFWHCLLVTIQVYTRRERLRCAKFRGFPIKSGFKPALVRRNVLFKTVLINTMPRDSMKSTAKPGLGQGLENDEHTCPPDGRRGQI